MWKINNEQYFQDKLLFPVMGKCWLSNLPPALTYDNTLKQKRHKCRHTHTRSFVIPFSCQTQPWPSSHSSLHPLTPLSVTCFSGRNQTLTCSHSEEPQRAQKQREWYGSHRTLTLMWICSLFFQSQALWFLISHSLSLKFPPQALCHTAEACSSTTFPVNRDFFMPVLPTTCGFVCNLYLLAVGSVPHKLFIFIFFV